MARRDGVKADGGRDGSFSNARQATPEAVLEYRIRLGGIDVAAHGDVRQSLDAFGGVGTTFETGDITSSPDHVPGCDRVGLVVTHAQEA